MATADEELIDTFAILLADTREGLARSGSKAKGVEQVQAMLAEHAGAIHQAATTARERRHRHLRHWNLPWGRGSNAMASDPTAVNPPMPRREVS